MEFPLNFIRRFFPESPGPQASIRQTNKDFQVDEILGFEPVGEGEHLYIQFRKNGQNTAWVKDQIARQLGVKAVDIGHAGLKDRHAVTTQWFSIYAPKRELDFSLLDIEGFELIKQARHSQKLRPGTHKANKFQIRLTNFEKAYREQTEQILFDIQSQGFANYFGEQRFGIDAGNLTKGWQLLESRKLKNHRKKGIYLSALRSYLFNQTLNAYIDFGSEERAGWEQTGPMWGRGRMNICTEQETFEKKALQPWKALYEALEYSGLSQERRALYVIPEALSWQWLAEDQLEMSFSLPPGSYATSLLNEFAEIEDMAAI